MMMVMMMMMMMMMDGRTDGWMDGEDEVDTDCLYCAGLFCEDIDSLEREVSKVGTHCFCELSEKGV